MSEEDFAVGESGVALTTPMRASNIKKGGYVMLKGHPCRVTTVEHIKNGKHGKAKNAVQGVDIFSGKKHDGLFPVKQDVEVPAQSSSEYTLSCISDDGEFVSMISDGGELRSDLRVPDNELGEQLAVAFSEVDVEVTLIVLSSMGSEQITALKREAY